VAGEEQRDRLVAHGAGAQRPALAVGGAQQHAEHARARVAAAAALAAQEQGRFWELHDWFFSAEARYDRDAILEEVGKLGMDPKRVAAELDSGIFEAKISADQAEAKRLGVQGTPTFFINGLRVMGAQPLDTLSGIVDAELRG
jgi:protein-disulfide isomerase